MESIRARLPLLRHVLLHGVRQGEALAHDTLDLHALLAEAEDSFTIAPTTADSPSLLHFTSGTTGTPKGALHVHGAAVTHYVSGKYALDLHPDDIYWCTADPGWVTGTSYGILAPLMLGVTSVVDGAEFDAERWYGILERQRVSVWYTAPTAIRLLMKAGATLAAVHRFPALRFVASVGEPLNAEAVWWGKEVLGQPIHDNWWQTETGGIMIANTAAMASAHAFRRRRDGGGCLCRDAEPGCTLAVAGAVLLRKQPLCDGHGAGPFAVPAGPLRQGRGLQPVRSYRRRHGCGRCARRGARSGSGNKEPARTFFVPIRCSTRNCIATRPRWKNGRNGGLSIPSAHG
ncbi:Acetyl-coenzyme A synthetase [compost metagenome]